jgi:hypothetical protein
VDIGSRKENASKQESRAPFRFHRNGKGSSLGNELSHYLIYHSGIHPAAANSAALAARAAKKKK